MNLLDFGSAGILPFSQYSLLFILSLNPGIFRFFRLRHFVFFATGSALSFLNHRAILPFMLIMILDLDFSKMDKRDRLAILFFFALQVLVLLTFGGWH